MPFPIRATVVCSLAGILTVAGLTPVRRTPVVGAAATVSAADDEEACYFCHKDAVEGYERSAMAQSMRLPAHEPEGIVHTPQATLRMASNREGAWQTLESHGVPETYRVRYVIGSGTHASGYIISVANHLFQSPVAWYTRKAAYGLAPGYETESDPDFTRPIKPGCLFCHAGTFAPVDGTVNEYAAQPFSQLSISCSRCHGPVSAHLDHPTASNIINPAHLDSAARDSVCEQCHLKGVARVLNPGRKFSDYVVGQPLETAFTTYIDSMPSGEQPPFKVISHSEELALSRCKRVSGNRMWCGTCHDPHHEPNDAETVAYYRAKCLTCHATTHFAPSHPPRTSNCVGCHMPKRAPNDGGHTVFTDHRIQRIPNDKAAGEPTGIVPWRNPPAELAKRNLGIGLIQAGTEERSWPQIVNGYRTLTEVQHQFPADCEMYQSMGNALFIGGQFSEAVIAFEMAERCDPESSSIENSLGSAYAALGKTADAKIHLEQALHLDPVNLSAADQLIVLYEKDGETLKADMLRNNLGSLFH
ncbi:MAG TPA: cytochrome c3 family protein [Acidobacteriaceae bacterium]|nr:cytochrome c3 family protein [Acidobacteriaceae bacterium]